MIYFFSGTGNSSAVAHRLSTLTHDECADIAKPECISAKSGVETVLGFIFPVYAWGLPLFVSSFLRRHLSFLLQQCPQMHYVYAVFTCGGDIGYADKELREVLASVNAGPLPLHAVWSVRMPNTYVCLPLFDADYGKTAKMKIAETASRLKYISSAIMQKRSEIVVNRGAFPSLKSGALRTHFNQKLVTDRYFYVLMDRCVKCGRCVGNCPTQNIEMVPEKPYIKWKGTECTGCLRCFHLCPENAIHFGFYTRSKHQHFMPSSLFNLLEED